LTQVAGLVNIFVRPADDTDEPFLRELYASTRPDLMALPEPTRSAILDMQYNLQRSQYAQSYPDREHWIVLDGSEPIGHYMSFENEDVFHFLHMALLPEHRNSGIGSAIFSDSFTRGKAVTLQVLTDNPARQLYLRLGFVETEIQGMHVMMRRYPES
jgi:GNAT superfamily N-acetyltransferase